MLGRRPSCSVTIIASWLLLGWTAPFLVAQTAVDPDGATPKIRANVTNRTARFDVWNFGAEDSWFFLNRTCQGAVISCSVPSSVEASGSLDYLVTVTPYGQAVTQGPYSNGLSATFTVSNVGSEADTYTFECFGSGTVTCTGISVASLFLNPGQSAPVVAYYNVSNVGTGDLNLAAFGNETSDQGWYTVTVQIPAGAPNLDPMPYNSELQSYRRCAWACFAATHTQGTVPYYSIDTPRNVMLVYNGDRVNPRTFVHVNVSPATGYSETATEYRLQVKLNGSFVTFVNNEQVLRFATSAGSKIRVGGQFDVSGFATNVYPLEIIVSALYPVSGLKTNVVTTKLAVVNETTSPLARGWTLAGVQRLYVQADGSALITEGDGSAVYFTKAGPNYLAPAGEFSRLVDGVPGGGAGWTRAFPDSTKIVFNTSGKMTEQRDRFNNIATIIYDSLNLNRISQIKDPLNLAITLAYDANGNLDAITDPMGRVTQITVNADTALTLIQDPDLVGTVFGYDANKRLSTITDRRGFTTTFGYDAPSGKLATLTHPSVEVVNADGSLSTAAPVTSFEAWHKKGVPFGSTSTPFVAPLADTVYARLTDPGGHTTRFTVNRWGAPAAVTDPADHTDSTSFDTNGLPIRVRYATGAVDSASYNSSGLPTWTRASGSTRTQFAYAGWGQADSIWGDGQVAVKRSVGVNGRIDWERVGGSTFYTAKTLYTYDNRGRVLTTTDPANHLVLKSSYLGQNENRSRDSTPGGRVTTYGYDTYGRRTTVTPPGNLATTTTYYSSINRIDSVRVGTSQTMTRYAYDALYLTSVTDEKNQVYGFGRNPLGWITTETDPLVKRDSMWYDRDGMLRRSKNRRNQIVEITYDALHRPITKSGSQGVPANWSYSADGLVVTASNAVSTLTDYYGPNSRLDSTRAVFADLPSLAYKVRYTFTAAGRVDSIIPSGPMSFTKRNHVYQTARGLLSEIRLGTFTTALSPNSDGATATKTFPGGDAVQRGISAAHQEAQTTTTASYAQSVERWSAFNASGRTWRHTWPYGATATGSQYMYDGRGRLTGDTTIEWLSSPPETPQCGTPPDPFTESGSTCTWAPNWYVDPVQGDAFAYDSVGNRTDNGGTYGIGNRIQAFGDCTYQTDDDGNVTQRACTGSSATFTWTAESWLKSVQVGPDTYTLYYDALGRLVRRDLNGIVQQRWLWAGATLLAELSSDGMTKVAEYSYYPGELDRLHAVIVGTTRYYAHADRLSNVVALTDEASNVFQEYRYYPWGGTAPGFPSSEQPNRARWKGAMFVVPGGVELYYMRARWYEPNTGRFLSEDPTGLDGGINPYVFGGDDPINRFDPTGLDYCEPDWSGGETVWHCISEDGEFYDCQDTDDPNACPGLTGGGEAPRGGLYAAMARSGRVIFYTPKSGDWIFLYGYNEDLIDEHGNWVTSGRIVANDLFNLGSKRPWGRTSFYLTLDPSSPFTLENPNAAWYTGKMSVRYRMWYEVFVMAFPGGGLIGFVNGQVL